MTCCVTGKGGRSLIEYILPKVQLRVDQLRLHISYFLQNCKKVKSPKIDLLKLKNDITRILWT